MHVIDTIRAEIAHTIERFLAEKGVEGSAFRLEKSPDFSHGDFSTPVAFSLAKQLKMAPLAVAEELASFLKEAGMASVAEVLAVNPGFVNITLKPEVYRDGVAEILSNPDFYKNETLKGEVWALEHTSPNPNKAMHLGHLRNNLVGMSVGRLLEASGAHVIYECIDNNRGIAIAKLMWGFLTEMRKSTDTPVDVAYWSSHQEEWYTPEEKEILPDIFVSASYIAGDALCADPLEEAKVRELVVLWEEKDPLVWQLWAYVLAYSYAGMDRTLRRLGNRWDVVWHEHEHYQKGKDSVEKGLAQGIFKTLDDGAVLTDLASYGIPDTILLKRDGTSLYITQDLALTALKKERYHADRMVWVVGPDQSLALKQLFAVCEQLGIGKVADFLHIPYGYMGLKGDDGAFLKMSSRKGTVVLIDDVIDTVHDVLKNSTLASHDISDEEGEARAEALALAAVKFSILKVERTQDMTFDVERSVEIKGDSGIYVMYTYVRTQSILRKARALGKNTYEALPVATGNELMRTLLFFPDVVLRAREDLSAHHIAQYLLELSGAFNRWYAEESILDGSDTEKHKLAVVSAVGTVLKEGCALLGIPMVDEM